MDLLKSVMIVSEKAAEISRFCRRNDHLFKLLVQEKQDIKVDSHFLSDFKTLADVLIQEMVKYELSREFPELRASIRGEENNTFSNQLGQTIKIEIDDHQDNTENLLEKVLDGDKEAAQLLAGLVHQKIVLNDVTTGTTPPDTEYHLHINNLGIWIDPIDCTAGYINGREDLEESGISLDGSRNSAVLIGVFDKTTKKPLIGVINQPFHKKLDINQWQGHCYWGVAFPDLVASSLPRTSENTRLVCLSRFEDQKIRDKLESNGFKLLEVAGAGYKILTVILGLADAYILTKNSTYKWDVCGPHAILKSLGGDIRQFDESRSVIEYDEYTNNRYGILAYKNEAVLESITQCLFVD